MDKSKVFPFLGAPENELLAYRDRVINRWSVYRNQIMRRVALNMWYHAGRQWAELDYAASFDGVRGAILQDIVSDSKVRPVTNIIDLPVEQEAIVLVKRKWVPKVTPTSDEPRIRAAAQVAKDLINHRLDQLFWPEKRHQLGMHFAVTGTSQIYTGWDKSYFELRTIAAPDAVWCPSCGTKLFSPTVPVETLRAGIDGNPVSYLDNATAADEMGENAELHFCPTCPRAIPLQPYSPNEEEMEEGNDVFGRPLGIQEPRGGSTIEVDLPFEFYPQNGGIRCTPDNLMIWGRRKLRSLEWVEERAFHIVDQIHPDPISELLYDDPFLGEWATVSRWNSSYDAGILDYHVNVDELVHLPSFRYPLGRYVMATKNKVIEDANLIEKATFADEKGDPQTVLVPRVMESGARFKLRLGDYHGAGLPDTLLSPQNQRNGILAQLIESRLRLGTPNVKMPVDMWVDQPIIDTQDTGVGNIFFYGSSLTNPQATGPEVMGGTLMPDSVYNEVSLIDTYVQRGTVSDPSVGQAPKNVGTTSGIERLIEMDENSRALREDELINSAEKSWTHLLQLEWALRVDEDTYRVLGPNKKHWKYEQYTRNVLRGQTEVKIERGSYIGKSIVRRESFREALADQVVVIDGPVTRKRALDNYGLDTDLNAEVSNQVDHADRIWIDYLDRDIIRTQDTLDDPLIHFQVLGTHLRSEEGLQRADDADWETINTIIAGWEDDLHQLQMAELAWIKFYGGRLRGDAAAMAYAQATDAYDQSLALYTQEQEMRNRVANDPSVPPPPPSLPPTKPPVPVEIPVLLQTRVLLVWTNLLKAKNYRPKDLAAESYIKIRALTEAYKLTMTGGIAPSAAGAMDPMAMGAGAGAGAGAAPMAPGTGATQLPGDKGLPPMPSTPPGNGGVGGGGGGGKPPSQPVASMPEGGAR